MAKKMLIDATQSEETRVAVLDHNNRLEEFDLEITSRQQIKGNIYLAKVTRVEPSLQAAFVNFGGNRHGFLPFSEIHPDYYRIPVSDREALQAEIEALLAKRQENEEEDVLDSDEEVAEVIAELAEEGEEIPAELAEEVAEVTDMPAEKPKRGRKKAAAKVEEVQDTSDAADLPPEAFEDSEAANDDDNGEEQQDSEGQEANSENTEGEGRRGGRRGFRFRRGGKDRGRNGNGRHGRSSGGGRGRPRGDDDEEGGDIQSYLFRRLHRSYKIQEVIKRGQIMLVQATKEERGNKGAAMTTYMSLPGRYCVLMPNSPRSGGVSRKIHDRKERDRLKDVFGGLEVPEGMSAILRTAGVGQKGEDIHRDYEYLQKNWGQIREKTLASTAPALIYQEGSVIKRAIRDIFREDVSEIIMSGKDAIAEAKEFMEMLVPSMVKRIKEHKAPDPLFVHHKAEEQIAAIDNNTVVLKSGGYLVFSPTEALVAIDINSGRSTRERHIEETALNTNLEAAEEIARQMRLRDIGGLVVIDFIDMEDHRHNILVERKLESALSKDRARIQIGRISQFGLLELSRQRLRPSLTESHFMTCPTCQGQGMIRTTESSAVVILRAIAQEGAKGKGGSITLAVPQAVCVYLLNNKRDSLTALEARYELKIDLEIDNALGESHYTLTRQKGETIITRVLDHHDHEEGSDIDEGEEVVIEEENISSSEADTSDKNRNRRGKRGGRNRRGGRDRERNNDDGEATASPEKELQPTDHTPEDHEEVAEKPKRGRPARPAKTATNDDAAPVVMTVDVPAAAPVVASPRTKSDIVKEYEVVNEAPEKPKKGWWRKALS